MGAAMSLDITGERIETVVQPQRVYTPTILSVRGKAAQLRFIVTMSSWRRSNMRSASISKI